jgi:hypothetical protein
MDPIGLANRCDHAAIVNGSNCFEIAVVKKFAQANEWGSRI